MTFLKQIKYEIKNILLARFLLITMILVVLGGLAIPVIGYLSSREREESSAPSPTAIRTSLSQVEKGINSIVIDGVAIDEKNPFYWQLSSLISEKNDIDADGHPLSGKETRDLFLSLIDEEIAYYLFFAKSVTSNEDYRVELAWYGIECLYDRFILEHEDVPEDVMLAVISYRKGMDPDTFRQKYVDMTAEERRQLLEKANENLERVKNIVTGNLFPQYIEWRIQMAKEEIAEIEKNIAIQEQAIIDDPSQEESLSRVIEDMRRQIKLISENTIPILEYRLEKNIMPQVSCWQNNALSDIENSRSQLAYLTILTEEEWLKTEGQWSRQTYEEYVATMRSRINALNEAIIIAQKSLDSGRPDMKYVPDGARSRTTNFLQYALLITLFGTLLGGWLMASEYQQGTIRLLMIRPRKRPKILMSKFIAALIIWLSADLACCLLNALMNGICFGFDDFSYPNYTVASQIHFFAYYWPRFLACLLPVLFCFALAFMLSVMIKNAAAAIVVPIVLQISSFIILNLFVYQGASSWLSYTPILYLQLPMLLSQNSIILLLTGMGAKITVATGVWVLLLYSAVCTGLSVFIFNRRDIVD
ncbi:MAG: ABC transporter permease subunit [Clostridia bacterium]|nr:ABC transporter permease subunit [Clostridia bacterium]